MISPFCLTMCITNKTIHNGIDSWICLFRRLLRSICWCSNRHFLQKLNWQWRHSSKRLVGGFVRKPIQILFYFSASIRNDTDLFLILYSHVDILYNNKELYFVDFSNTQRHFCVISCVTYFLKYNTGWWLYCALPVHALKKKYDCKLRHRELWNCVGMMKWHTTR